jgi:predicted nucleic acid-binding protein
LREFICNTSPFQYLHQLSALEILKGLTGGVVVPPSVQTELDEGRRAGHDLPDLAKLDWVRLRRPQSTPVLPLAADLGPGESAVLALALESQDACVILDDGLARRAASLLGIPFTGTLGLLIDGKRKGLIPAVAPLLDRLDVLRFRVSASTRAAVLQLAGEDHSRLT